MAEVSDHYRPTDDSHDSGIYRVVGVTDDVTLLRVTDAGGRRVHSGEIRHVSAHTLDAEFEPAENPDAGFSPISAVQNLLSGLYWSVRRFF